MSQLPGRAGRLPHGGCAILSRYALVLDTIAHAPPGGLALSDISQRTELPQATVYRLVHALVHVGFLATGERRRHYVLGPRLLRLMPAGIPGRTAYALAKPILDRLAADYGVAAFIAKLEGFAVAMLGVAMPDGMLPGFVQPGRLMPFHAAASAKAILAFADEYLYNNFLQKTPLRYTSRTKTDQTEIANELARIREQGFAVCDQELDTGVVSYACPVRIGSAAVVYSMGLVGFAERLSRTPVDAVVSSLKVATGDFSNLLCEERDVLPNQVPNWPSLALFSQRDDGFAVDR